MSAVTSLSPAQQLAAFRRASEAALSNWGISDATLSLIKHRENAVFRVDWERGPHALRVHRYGYHSDAALRSELQWMQALDAAGIQTPTVVPTRSGDLFVAQPCTEVGGDVQIDLFEWLDGEELGTVDDGIANADEVATSYHTLGQIAARVHNQAVDWIPPADFKRHAWDADGLAGDAPFWGRFWDLELATPVERDTLVRGRDHVYKSLSQLAKSSSNYSLLHADFVPENLMVCGDEIKLIDFDDAGFGWHLFEIATALYFICDEPYFAEARDAMVAGYRENRALSDEDLARLPLFLMARGFTYLGWVHTRPDTETARDMTPALLEMALNRAREYGLS